MKFELLGKRLAFIIAHPDDESFLAAGTIVANKEAAGKSLIFCATLGEQGRAHLQKPVSEVQLKIIRKKELQDVSTFLGVDRLLLGSLPDYKLSICEDAMYARAMKELKKWKPDIVLSFGKDGFSGHLDHIAVGKVAKRISKDIRLPFVAFSASPVQIHRAETLKERRKLGVYTKRIFYQHPNYKIKIKSGVKEKALSFHVSQHGGGILFQGIPPAAIRQNVGI